MMNAIALNDKNLELVAGGRDYYKVSNAQLKKIGLDGYIHCDGGWLDNYYDTRRGDTEWKNVGSEDMLKYAERTFGTKDPRYQVLRELAFYGFAYYNGETI